MMKFIGKGKDLKGYSAADMIVGKAAAMLFVKAGICAVHGKVMSEAASEYLEAHHIPHSYDKLTEQIINRTGDNICPMEAAVANISDPEEGYNALFNKIQEMRKKQLTPKLRSYGRSFFMAECLLVCGIFNLSVPAARTTRWLRPP